jgi:propanediol utilization protein
LIIILLRPTSCISIASNKTFLHISIRNIRSSHTQIEVSRTDAFVLAMRSSTSLLSHDTRRVAHFPTL